MGAVVQPLCLLSSVTLEDDCLDLDMKLFELFDKYLQHHFNQGAALVSI